MSNNDDFNNADHRDGRTTLLGAAAANATASYSAIPQYNAGTQTTIAVVTSTNTNSAPSVVHSLSASHSTSESSFSPLSKLSSSQQAITEVRNYSGSTSGNKIIIGSIVTASVMIMLVAVAYWLHRRQMCLRRRPRASTLFPPLSPMIGTESKRSPSIIYSADQEPEWTVISYNCATKVDSPRVSIDSGLGVILERQPSTTITSTKNAYLSNIESQDGTEMKELEKKGKFGGPLTSNPPTGPSSPMIPTQTTFRERNDVKEHENNNKIASRSPMPSMGHGALTARSSQESLRIIETMEPASPKHRQLSPTKSILKKRSPSPDSMQEVLPEPVPEAINFVEPEKAEKEGKRSALKKRISGMLRHNKEKNKGQPEQSKEKKVVVLAEEPPKKRTKAVSFGEETIRRVSWSTETDEGDWETVDSRSDDSEERGL